MIVRMPWPSGTSRCVKVELQLEVGQNGQEKGSLRWIVVSFSLLGSSNERVEV
jgi:hypothetical protein